MAVVVIALIFSLIPRFVLSEDIPLPTNIEIVTPAPDLPKEIKAFSGKWEGIWDGYGLKSILIVEEIDPKEAKIIYACGEGPGVQKGYSQYIAKVTLSSKSKIEFGRKTNNYEVKFTFEMQEDLKTIKGMRKYHSNGGNFWTSIKMKKIED